MKFTNGCWQMKDQFKPLYAIEYESHEVIGDSLVVYAATKPQNNRGCAVDSAIITFKFCSNIPGIINVTALHFDTGSKKPEFNINSGKLASPRIICSEGFIDYISGELTARISTIPGSWDIKFLYEGRKLTGSTSKFTAYMSDRDSGNNYMVNQLELGVGEYIYGLGERFTPFIKNGQTVEIWNADGGTGSELSYKNTPFYMSNKGYGVFVDHPGDVAFEIGSENVERVQFSIKGEEIKYHVIAGADPKQVIERYTLLTGRPALPPAWSFGLWLSTSFTTDYDEETVTSFIKGMQDREIPLSVFHFDCFWMKQYRWCDFIWDDEVFPNPEEMLARLKGRGLKICAWINPYIAQRSDLFEEAKQKGYLLHTADGNVWQTDMWQAGMGIVDFTNPGAVKWYQGKLKALLDMGVDCFKTDFGERIPVKNIAYYDGSDPVRMHNYYTYLYNRAVFDLIEEYRGKGNALVFARSATAGGQTMPVHWGGDCTASYPSMAETLRGGLSLSTCGFGFWSHDISGFESTATADLYKRWCAFGLLSSHSRLHGSSSYRVPWNFDEESSLVLKSFVELKHRLMPYLYGHAVKAHQFGYPMMRPMFMEFPQDPACTTLDLQYMLGDSLLVAPVFNEQGNVTYYLPDGIWTNIITGEKIKGGRYINEKHGYLSLPVMVRPNTALPMGTVTNVPDYDYVRNLVIGLFEIQDGADIDLLIPCFDSGVAANVKVTCNNNVIEASIDKDVHWAIKLDGTIKESDNRIIRVNI